MGHRQRGQLRGSELPAQHPEISHDPCRLIPNLYRLGSSALWSLQPRRLRSLNLGSALIPPCILPPLSALRAESSRQSLDASLRDQSRRCVHVPARRRWPQPQARKALAPKTPRPQGCIILAAVGCCRGDDLDMWRLEFGQRPDDQVNLVNPCRVVHQTVCQCSRECPNFLLIGRIGRGDELRPANTG